MPIRLRDAELAPDLAEAALAAREGVVWTGMKSGLETGTTPCREAGRHAGQVRQVNTLVAHVQHGKDSLLLCSCHSVRSPCLCVLSNAAAACARPAHATHLLCVFVVGALFVAAHIHKLDLEGVLGVSAADVVGGHLHSQTHNPAAGRVNQWAQTGHTLPGWTAQPW